MLGGSEAFPLSSITPGFDSLVLSPTLFNPAGTMFITPSISSIEFINRPGGIIPPTMIKTNILSQPIGIIGEGSLLLPSDIFVPSFQLVSDLGAGALRLPLGLFNDSCDIPHIKESVTKIFYYKMLDKWLYDKDDSKKLLGYLKVVDGKVELIKDIDNKDDYMKNDQATVDKKVEFIEKNIFRIDDVFAILKKFVDGTRISWCDLTKNGSFIRDAMNHTLEKMFKRLIKK